MTDSQTIAAPPRRPPDGCTVGRLPGNYVYIARRLAELGVTGPVLDLGCGDGGAIAYLRRRGLDVAGCELPYREPELRRRFGAEVGDRIRLSSDPGTIPFGDAAFAAVFANQVFEHVGPLPAIARECRRVLRPGGALIAPFPLRSTPIETHTYVPFVHWLTPPQREPYLRFWFALPFTQRGRPGSRTDIAARVARYLNAETCYRSRREIEALLREHFSAVSLDATPYVSTKLEVLAADRNARFRLMARTLRCLPTAMVEWTFTYCVNASFVATA